MEAGRYLRRRDRKRQERERMLRMGKMIRLVLTLAAGNAVLVYLIEGGLLDGTWGAGLTAVLSASLGYQLKGVSV